MSTENYERPTPPVYNVSNPHPGFGKDDNILNEFGHTMYPKYVKNEDGNLVIVNNKKEELEATGEKEVKKAWK